MRDPQQQRRIDAARKADQRRTVAGDDFAQPRVLVGERQIGGSGGGHRHCRPDYTTIRSLPATAAAISAATSSLASTRSASWARARVAGCDGHEQRAAVLEGEDRRLVGADAARERGGLDLVVGDERPQHDPPRGRLDGGQVLDRLAGDLTQVLAGHQRARLQAVGDLVGDAHHHAPVEHDGQLGRTGVAQALLRVGERHDGHRTQRLPAREQLAQRQHLVARLLADVRRRVEVDGVQREAALGRQPARDGRVDAARQQQQRAARRADGQAAGRVVLAGEHVRDVGPDLDADPQRGRVHVDGQAGRGLDGRADVTVDVQRALREALVGAARFDLERRGAIARDGGARLRRPPSR